MVVRKRKKKKVNQFRGTRRHGGGNIKNRRGSGNRGGRGHAGWKKHKFTRTVKYEKDLLGKKGFVRHAKDKRLPVLNIYDIENMLLDDKLKKEGNAYVFEFKGKLLGSGFLSSPVKVKALSWTKKAEEKIKKAGGELIKIE